MSHFLSPILADRFARHAARAMGTWFSRPMLECMTPLARARTRPPRRRRKRLHLLATGPFAEQYQITTPGKDYGVLPVA